MGSFAENDTGLPVWVRATRAARTTCFVAMAVAAALPAAAAGDRDGRSEAAAAWLCRQGAEVYNTDSGVAAVFSDKPSSPGSLWRGPPTAFARLVEVANVTSISFDCDISPPRALAFLPKLKSLRSLIFMCCGSLDDVGFRHVWECKDLEDLTVVCSGLTDKGAAGLAKLGHLRRLVLWGDYSDKAADVVAGLGSVRRLTFITGKITDAGVRQLAKLTEIEGLELVCAKVTDASVPVLGRLHHLRRLNVRGTQISLHGAHELERQLPRCHVAYDAGPEPLPDNGGDEPKEQRAESASDGQKQR
jgi:hypothetical protein